MDASKGVEHDQVGVAGDDVLRVPAYCKFEEFIVLWIPAGKDLDIDVDPLGLARQSGEKAPNIFLIDVTAELLSAQNIVKFSENSEREENFSASKRKIKSPPRLRVVQK